MSSILIGRIIKKIPNSNGGFYVVLAEGENSRRFRADCCLFPADVPADSIISFLAETAPRRSKQMPKIIRILSAPLAESETQ
jgi:hypothetical protein